MEKKCYKFYTTRSKSMTRIYIIIFKLLFISSSLLYAIEVNITKGQIEPLPIAIVQFNNQNPEEFQYSSKINDVISSNLKNTSLFKILPEESFLQSKNEVFLQPIFADWRLIDANFLVSGIISYADNNLSINFKLWDVYQEKLIINKSISGVNLADWRISSHIISNLIYEGITGEKGYFDTKVVYVAEENLGSKKSKKLAMMDYDGFNHTILTDGSNIVLTPRFSPDGKDIVFLQFKDNKASVYLMNLKNKKIKILGNYLGMSFAPRFSPNGRRIVFSLTS